MEESFSVKWGATLSLLVPSQNEGMVLIENFHTLFQGTHLVQEILVQILRAQEAYQHLKQDLHLETVRLWEQTC